MQLDIKVLAKEYFKPIFKAYDKDGNGTLQKSQLRGLLADSLGINQNDISQDQLDWHFSKLDFNADGSITFDEYFSYFFGQRAKDSAKNQTQLIDINQFRKMLQDTFKCVKITVTQQMVQYHFNCIDTDADGRIEFKEYLAFIKKYN